MNLEDGQSYQGVLEGLEWTEQSLRRAHFEGVTFRRCRLENLRLLECSLVDCQFEATEMLGLKLPGTTLNGVQFERCRMMGIDFADLRQFVVTLGFRDCLLDYGCFTRMHLARTTFADCRMREVDFSHATLDASTFGGCDLSGAHWNHASLVGCDLRDTEGLLFDPRLVKLGRTKLDLDTLVALGKQLGIEVGMG